MIDDNYKRTSCLMKVRSDANIERVYTYFAQNPRDKTPQAADALGLSRMYFLRIIHKDIQMISYKIQFKQKLIGFDNQCRIDLL